MLTPQTSFSLRQWVYMACAAAMLVLIALWLAFIAPSLKKMPEDFTYTANILSIDNFYDERTQKFQGEHISKTTFSYQVLNAFSNYYIIENKFAVRTLNDVPIISVTRIYYINPYNWEHTFVSGKSNRVGNLFGPQYADKLNYKYWHINYDTQAILKFINNENIEGLNVYHFQANYTADQSKELSYLRSVQNNRGVKTDIILDIWIEPITGWLVKYADNSIGYFYDLKTDKIISPWNKFSNRYTLTSVRDQVEKASQLKKIFLIADYGVPFFLLLISLVFACVGLNIKIMPRFLIKVFDYMMSIEGETYFRYSISIVLIIFSVITIYYFTYYNKSPRLYTIGVSQWSDNGDLVNTINGFKEGLNEAGYKEGVNVKYLIKNPNANIENQIRIIQEFLNKNVDMLFVLTTPGTLIAKGMTESTPIIFANVIYPEKSEIISPMQISQNNLVGVSNYISPAKQFHAFERLYPDAKSIAFVHRKGDPDSENQYREYQRLLGTRDIQVINLPVMDIHDIGHQLSRKDIAYDVLAIACDTLMQDGGGIMVADFAYKNKIPNFSCDRSSILNGGLIGIVADPYKSGFMAGKQAGLILDGAEPFWLNTERAVFENLIINEKTAKQLGIKIPHEMLNKSNNVIVGN